jgi:hypothetical protein
MPVPVRKWYIKRFNERQQEQAKDQPGSDTSQPLTDSERRKMIAQSQQANMSPRHPPDLMKSMRNKS